MSESTSQPNGDTITPQEAWKKLCGMYLIAARDQLKHSVICPKPDVTLQGRQNTRGQKKFRIICLCCGAQAEIPSEPDWHAAWGIIDKPLIQFPG